MTRIFLKKNVSLDIYGQILDSKYYRLLKNYIHNNTGERLGELFFKSKHSALDLAISNQYPHNIYSGYRFNIFGDPALPLLISSANNLTEIDTISIGLENHLELNNNNYSGLKIFDEDVLNYKLFNHT